MSALGLLQAAHIRRPVQNHAAHNPLSGRRRLTDGFIAVKRYCGDEKKQIIKFQINGPTHVNHD